MENPVGLGNHCPRVDAWVIMIFKTLLRNYAFSNMKTIDAVEYTKKEMK